MRRQISQYGTRRQIRKPPCCRQQVPHATRSTALHRGVKCCRQMRTERIIKLQRSGADKAVGDQRQCQFAPAPFAKGYIGQCRGKWRACGRGAERQRLPFGGRLRCRWQTRQQKQQRKAAFDSVRHDWHSSG